MTVPRIDALPFPYYVLTEGTKQEDITREGNHYIVARNGIFMHKGTTDLDDERNGLVESVTRVLNFPAPFTFSGQNWKVNEAEERDRRTFTQLPGLADCIEYACVKTPPIPHEVARLALAFFSRVFREHGSESEVQVYYNVRTRTFKLVCPEQTVSRGGVEYVRGAASMQIDGLEYRLVGTIHSHCDFNAFHSGTDTADEEHQDGIHITFGHVNAMPISVVASVVANGRRFQQNPLDVIEGITASGTRSSIGTGWHQGTETFEQFFNLPNLDSLGEARVLEQVLDWFPRVTKQAWSVWGTGGKGRRKGNRYGGYGGYLSHLS